MGKRWDRRGQAARRPLLYMYIVDIYSHYNKVFKAHIFCTSAHERPAFFFSFSIDIVCLSRSLIQRSTRHITPWPGDGSSCPITWVQSTQRCCPPPTMDVRVREVGPRVSGYLLNGLDMCGIEKDIWETLISIQFLKILHQEMPENNILQSTETLLYYLR
jgi:hypothetical protein